MHRGFPDRAEAADRAREGEQRLRRSRVAGIERTRHLIDDPLVLVAQPALALPLLRASEHIESAAAQALHAGKQAEERHHPGAEAALGRTPSPLVGARQQRRGEMELQLLEALEGLRKLPLEAVAGEEPGDLVFILDRHQAKQLACHRLADLLAGRAKTACRLRQARDALAVARRIGRVLVVGEEGSTARDHLLDAFRQAPVLELVGTRLRRPHHRLRIHRRDPPPGKGGQVHLHRHLVEADRLFQGLTGQRQGTELPAEAEQEHVGGDGIAEEFGGKLRRIDEAGAVRPCRLTERRHQAPAGKAEVGIAGKVARQGLVGVDHREAPSRRHRREDLG